MPLLTELKVGFFMKGKELEQDEFELEVELLRNNKEFMAYLDELSAQQATISLEEVEKILELGED
jgi:hypothetical protein